MKKFFIKSLYSSLLVIMALLFVVQPLRAIAISELDYRCIYAPCEQYAPENTSRDCTPSTSETTTSLTGSDNLEKIYRYFVQKGLTPEQAAGITGNAYAESGGSPTAENRNYQGVFQWDKKVRWPRLLQFATTKGLDPKLLATQLDFAWDEATARKNIDGIKAQGTTAALAAWYWGRFFEVAIIDRSTSTVPLTNVQALSKRIAAANDALRLYGTSSPAANTDPTDAPEGENDDTLAPVTSAGTCTGAGQNTQYVDGFTFYDQYDPTWKDKPYSSSTIAESGCGPTSMAMIITSLTGSRVSPVQTAEYAGEQGLYVPGQGSKSTIAPILATKWELKSQPIVAGVAEISAALQAGKLVIVGGRGSVPFTSEGHIIVIRVVTADGKWKIADSASSLPGHETANQQSWDPQQILNSVAEGTTYAISK